MPETRGPRPPLNFLWPVTHQNNVSLTLLVATLVSLCPFGPFLLGSPFRVENHTILDSTALKTSKKIWWQKVVLKAKIVMKMFV